MKFDFLFVAYCFMFAVFFTACDQVDPLPEEPAAFAPLLGAPEVETVVRRALTEATERGASIAIAVTDREGNPLALYSMAGASAGSIRNAQACASPVLKTSLQ